jgi:hypothetical protein
MIFFVYWKVSPDAPWTVYGTYEDGAQAHLVRNNIKQSGKRTRLVTSA